MKEYRKIAKAAHQYDGTKYSLKLFALLVFLWLSEASAHAGHLHKEKEYQECWCAENNGAAEYVLPDRTRVDCLTDEYAIEFDFAEKWAESIGQAMYYSIMTGRKPGIVLIVQKGGERFVERARVVAKELDIKVWVVSSDRSQAPIAAQ